MSLRGSIAAGLVNARRFLHDWLGARGGARPAVDAMGTDAEQNRAGELEARGGAAGIVTVRRGFHDLARRMVSATPVESAEVIAAALRFAVEDLDLERAFVRLLAEDEAHYVTAYEHHRPGLEPVAPREVTTASIGWAHDRFVRGEVVVLSSPEGLPPDEHTFRAALERVGVRATVSVPVLDGPRVLGYVAYPAQEGRAWTGAEIETLRLLGDMIAAVVVRTQAEAGERGRMRFEEQLSAAARRFVDIAAEDVDEEVGRTLSTMGPSLDVDRAMVLTLDEEGRAVSVTQEWCAPAVPSVKAIFTGCPPEALPPLLRRAFAGEAIVGRAEDAPPGSATEDLLRRLTAHAFVLSPLHIEGRIQGVMSLETLTHRRHSPEAEVLARTKLIADVIAAALSHRAARVRNRNWELRFAAERQRAFDEVSRQKRKLERERDYLREEHRASSLVGASPAIRDAFALVEAVAETGSSVLLLGESGVGKEAFASAVHAHSGRRSGPFVKVNCASVPGSLFESEFFGHAKGSFTGAVRDRIGRFELADGGTLFLDEVGEIPLDLQAKLLRVLQEGEIERVGEDRTRRLDVRIVTATNRDLEQEVTAGRFRSDLYFRLGVFPIHIPPLRARGEDIVLLARHFLARHAAETRRTGLSLSPDDEARLLAYDWPGNVRELDHVLQRAVILSRTPPLRLDLALPYRGAGRSISPPELLREDDLRRLERENLVLALKRAGGRVSGPGGAADLLGTNPSTLRDRMKAFGISRSD